MELFVSLLLIFFLIFKVVWCELLVEVIFVSILFVDEFLFDILDFFWFGGVIFWLF